MSITSEIEHIEHEVASLWPVWDGKSPDMGLRQVQVSGFYLRDEAHCKAYLLRLKEEVLPSDAALWGFDGQLVRPVYGGVGLLIDKYCLAFASSSWPSLTEGDYIPELEIKWTVQTRSVMRVDKRRYAVRFENESEHSVDIVIAGK